MLKIWLILCKLASEKVFWTKVLQVMSFYSIIVIEQVVGGHMQEPTLTKKQFKFLKHISSEMSQEDSILIKNALLEFSKNLVFNDAFSKLVAVGSNIECVKLDDYVNLTCPIQIIQPEGRFDAELEISIFKDEDTPKVQFIMNCVNEIFYDLPMNSSEEIERFWDTPLKFYQIPENSLLICSKYLDTAFFAVNKDYCFIANYDASENCPVNIDIATAYFSGKSFKSYPDYMYEFDKLRKDHPFYSHYGGTRRYETNYSFNNDGSINKKSISVDTFFKVIREFRKFNITAMPKGCLVERVEYGLGKPSVSKEVKLNSLTKKINLSIEDLENLNDIIKEFELRCSNGEKSKLRNFQQHKSHNLKNDEKFKLNSFYKEFWEYQRKKSGKLSYEENKQLKESMHDDSILWHLKQQALKQHSQSLEQTAEQVMGRTMTSFARNNKDTKQTAQNVILM